MAERSHILILGRIQRAKGLNGDIRVTAFGELLSKWQERSQLDLYSGTSAKDGFIENPEYVKSLNLELVKEIRSNGIIVLRFQEYTQKDLIDDELKGLYIGLDLEKAKEKYGDLENPYLFQWLDLKVFDRKNLEEAVGIICGFEEYSGKVLFRICSDQYGEFLLPSEIFQNLKPDWENNHIISNEIYPFIEALKNE